MNKYLRSVWKKLMVIRPWYFLILCVISSAVCIYALRQNNLTMERLRQAVYTADKNNGDVAGALQNLQAYVVSHMNTSLATGKGGAYPPIQLEYTYQRLQQAALAKLGYSSFYTQAQNICQAKYPIESSLYIWQSYVACVQQYLGSQHLDLQVASYVPPPALYEFDFTAAKWSPDLAGWSLVASIVLLILFVASWLTNRWLRHAD